MKLEEYLNKVNTRFKTGLAREHSYRGDLQTLLETLAPDVLVTNEPARIACGAPDYIITKQHLPIGYIEAKDLGADLNSPAYQEQFERYRQSLPNLIITDYLHFQLFRNGQQVTSLTIGHLHKNTIVPHPEQFPAFIHLIREFCTYTGQTISSPSTLSKMMAAKARLLANVIEKALISAEQGKNQSESDDLTLRDQYRSFQQILIHDITEKEFADMYAQTIAYGMFAARLHDPTVETFTRHKAAQLIPHTNPFLRKLFQYIAGYDLDDRITWIVEALADIFSATDVSGLLKDFGKATQQHDPIIHFYETFLSEYDPALRKSRGVWYTPEPVVQFIVRAVDDILKTEFHVPQGLADTGHIKIEVPDAEGKKGERVVHRVQILDPAAGTGTFLAGVIKHIHKSFEGQQGIWGRYVEEHLIPRLNGFELLMASYAMAHLQCDWLLKETGYKPKKEQRLRIFLTNSVEEHSTDTGALFASWLSAEANEANQIKKDVPVMVVLGNPPYSGESANKGKWITNLMEDYKREPGGKGKLQERNSKSINDDYVKFIRYGQYYIERNGKGIVAFINPHGFLDNPTFRGMRGELLRVYDTIYIIDLHGNTRKKEVSPDGGKDENVFDIMQGVSINIFIKTGRKKEGELGKVYHVDLYGSRESKYAFLYENSFKEIKYKEVLPSAPNYYFVPKDLDIQEHYNEGFSVSECFILYSVGVVTSKDTILISDAKDILLKNVEAHYKIEAREDTIKKIAYRPFDEKHIYYDLNLVERAREKVMHHFLKGENVGLILEKIMMNKNEVYKDCFVTKNIYDGHCIGSASYSFPLYVYPICKGENVGLVFKRGGVEDKAPPVFLSKKIIDYRSWSRPGIQGGDSIAPLYLYPNEALSMENTYQREPNLHQEIVSKMSVRLGLLFTPEKESTQDSFSPIDILDYIYAVLHSPTYRQKYKEFLKIDFPRVPYPKDTATFWTLVQRGGQLRTIHLLENPIVEKYITTYPQDGTHEVVKVRYDAGKVWINAKQYFEGVPEVAWGLYIGGYQPAQKWLKDRKGRCLSFEEVSHYQKIIIALTETDRLMNEIDTIV